MMPVFGTRVFSWLPAYGVSHRLSRMVFAFSEPLKRARLAGAAARLISQIVAVPCRIGKCGSISQRWVLSHSGDAVIAYGCLGAPR